jgi:hypothetical protein
MANPPKQKQVVTSAVASKATKTQASKAAKSVVSTVSTSVVTMAKYIMPDPVGALTPAGDAGSIANWGLDNLFPDHNIMHSKESTTNGAILRVKTRLSAGKMLILDGLDKTAVKALFPKSSPSKFATCTIKDYNIHGCFAWVVCYTRDHTRIAYLQHVDVSTLRKLMNKDGDLIGFRQNPKWTGKGKVKKPDLSKDYPVFDPLAAANEGKRIKAPGSGLTFADSKQVQQIYFYENYEPGCPSYPYPDYFPADRSIQFEIEFDKFHLHGIRNGFRPQVFMEVMGVMEDEEQKKIEAGFKKALDPEGSMGMLSFTGDASGQRNQAINLKEIENKGHDAKFLNMATDARQRIITAHGLTSPVIAGLSGRATLGGNGQEIKEAYTIFYNTCIAAIQTQFLECLEEVLSNGGIACTPSITRFDPWEAIADIANIFAPDQIGDGEADGEDAGNGGSGSGGGTPESSSTSTGDTPDTDSNSNTQDDAQP